MAGIFDSKKGGGIFQCKGITNAGKHCKIKCNSVFCYHHQFQELPLKETCPICFDPIKNKIKIDCKHSFCNECFQKVLEHSRLERRLAQICNIELHVLYLMVLVLA